MYRNTFRRLENKDAQSVLAEVNPFLDGSPFTGETVVVLSQDLSFYPGYHFLEITDHALHPVRTIYCIYKPGEVTVLSWSNEPIYQLNAKVPIHLTEDNAAQYVIFFFSYVRGRHGRFLICEGIDDIQWRDDPPPQARKAISKMLIPVTITHKDAEGTMHLIATMVFKDSLFKSQVHLKPDGAVSLSNEELLVEDLPVIDDLIGL